MFVENLSQCCPQRIKTCRMSDTSGNQKSGSFITRAHGFSKFIHMHRKKPQASLMTFTTLVLLNILTNPPVDTHEPIHPSLSSSRVY